MGVNGSGKSSFFDAISYVLYNRTIKDLNIPQLINTKTQKDLLVEIELETEKNHYMISRGMKPNIFEIYKNGVLLNQDSDKKVYQELLEKTILKMNFKTFKQIVLLSSTNFVPFLLLPAAGRRSVIEDLLDIEIFSVMNSILKDQIANNKASLISNEDKVLSTKNMIAVHKKFLVEQTQNNQDLIDDKISKIAVIRVTTSERVENSKSLTENLVLHNEKIQLLPIWNTSLGKLETTKSACLQKKKNILKDISFYTSNDDCPTCKQSITNEFKEQHLQKKNDTLKKLDQIYDDINKEHAEKTALVRSMDVHLDEIKRINTELIVIKTTVEQQKRYVKDLTKEIEQLKNKAPEIRKDDLGSLNDLLSEYEQTKIGLLEDRELLNVSSTLLKDGGIKSHIIKQYIPTMNKLIGFYLQQMEFDTVFGIDENFDEKVTTRFKETFSYNSFSKGQQMRIDIALMLTWRDISRMRNSVSTNILLLDETFDGSLDDQGNEDVLHILKNLIKDMNLFMISHKFNMADKFDRVIEFRDEKGFSKIV